MSNRLYLAVALACGWGVVRRRRPNARQHLQSHPLRAGTIGKDLRGWWPATTRSLPVGRASIG